MKIVIAPDSFKGCLSSAKVAEAVAEGVLDVMPDAEIVTVPVADGGEGTVEALVCGAAPNSTAGGTAAAKAQLACADTNNTAGGTAPAKAQLACADTNNTAEGTTSAKARLVCGATDSTAGGTAPAKAQLACADTDSTAGGTADAKTQLVYHDTDSTAEGTAAAKAQLVYATVSDPLGRPVKASYGIVGETAIIESAAACGLVLLKPEERNPLLTNTRGLGELILDAIGRGCREFLVGLGGSATNDGGRGMIETPGLLEAARGLRFTVACDVNTPFIGPVGASRVFGPQKGASPEDVEILEKRLSDYSEKILEDTGIDVRDMPGTGAAGGLGGAFHAYLGGILRRGVDMVLDFIGFDETLEGADLVITGEGRSDFQTPAGKTPAGVLERAKRKGIPAALLSGAVADCPELRALGFEDIVAATPEGTPTEIAIREDVARKNLRSAASKIVLKHFGNE